MTNQKHTPGPWKLHKQRPTMAEPSHRVLDTAGLLVAEGRAAGGPLRQATENAILIAAASALLAENARLREALQRLLRAFEVDSEQAPESNILDCWQINSTAIAQARKALAAQGGEAICSAVGFWSPHMCSDIPARLEVPGSSLAQSFPCEFNHCRNLAVSKAPNPVHSIGHPISHSTQGGFNFPPTPN